MGRRAGHQSWSTIRPPAPTRAPRCGISVRGSKPAPTARAAHAFEAFRAGATRLARRLRAVHGDQGCRTGAGLVRLAAAARSARAGRARDGATHPGRWCPLPRADPVCLLRAVASAQAATPTRAASRWSATFRSSWPTIAPTSGSTRISSSSTQPATPPSWPACRRITSARPASAGATRCTAGIAWPSGTTTGGSSGSAARCSAVDVVRLDHFRGFEAYWEVPAEHETAVQGRWVPGPGAALFDGGRASARRLPIIAEDLGLITPEVERAARPARLPRHEGAAVRLRR